MANTFNFIGKIVPVKDTDKFKGYEEIDFKSGWMNQRLRFNLIAGDNRHLIEINAGRWKDDSKNDKIYTMSKATADKKSEKIQIPWADRDNPEVINSVAGYRVFTVDTDTYEHREELEKNSDEKALEESKKKRRHFLAGTDFCNFAKKVIYNEKIKDWTFRITGNIIYTYSEKTGQYYSSYEATKIYRVSDDKEPSSNVNIEFYYADNFMDKDSIEDSGKAIMSGYTRFYDNNTGENWFAPIGIIMRETLEKAEGIEGILSDFNDNEICKVVLSCQAINGAQKRDVELSDLDEKTQKAVRLGLMSEAQAIRNAGGQLYGDKIQEIRFNDMMDTGEVTAFTLKNCMTKPYKKDELPFEDVNEEAEEADDDDEI